MDIWNQSILIFAQQIHEGHNYTKDEEDKIDKEILELEKKVKAVSIKLTCYDGCICQKTVFIT